jgi:hypothetical protein
VYLIIYACDAADGVSVQYTDKEGLKRMLAEWTDDGLELNCRMLFSETMHDLDNWPSYTAFVMKGVAVVPRPVTKVTEWDVP